MEIWKYFIHQFKNIVEGTGKDFKERLVNLCSNDGDIRLSDICIGDGCKIPEQQDPTEMSGDKYEQNKRRTEIYD